MSELEKSLVQEIHRTGFLLEKTVADEFKLSRFVVESNLLLPNAYQNEQPYKLIEVDVFATQTNVNNSEAYIVECKGASKDDVLALIPTDDGVSHLPTVFFEKDKIHLDGNNNLLCINKEPRTLTQQPYCCHTGDFFTYKKIKKDNLGIESYSRASKNEDQNNLYKGIVQLYYALEAVYWGRRALGCKITAMIATNAKIKVLRADGKTLDDVPWAAYRNPIFYRPGISKMGHEEWTYNGGSDANIYASQKRIPLIWIVNSNHIGNFIQAPGKSYPKS